MTHVRVSGVVGALAAALALAAGAGAIDDAGGGGKPVNLATGSASEMVSNAQSKNGLMRSKRDFVNATNRPVLAEEVS